MKKPAADDVWLRGKTLATLLTYDDLPHRVKADIVRALFATRLEKLAEKRSPRARP